MRLTLRLTRRALFCALLMVLVAVPALMSAARTNIRQPDSNAGCEPLTTPTPLPRVRFHFRAVDESNHAVTDLLLKEVNVTDNGVPQLVERLEIEDLPL